MSHNYYLEDEDISYSTDNNPGYKKISSLKNNYNIFDLQDAYLVGVPAVRENNEILVDVNINNQRSLMIKKIPRKEK